MICENVNLNANTQIRRYDKNESDLVGFCLVSVCLVASRVFSAFSLNERIHIDECAKLGEYSVLAFKSHFNPSMENEAPNALAEMC